MILELGMSIHIEKGDLNDFFDDNDDDMNRKVEVGKDIFNFKSSEKEEKEKVNFYLYI